MRVVLTGGGTGGHIYPALAIGRYIRERYPEAEILYVGTKHGLERDIVPREGFTYEFIEVQGLKRSLSLQAVKTAWLAITSAWTARRVLRRFRPQLVIGTGGYVVAPVVFAAYSLGIPSAILEMDVFAGLANRMASRVADTVMLSMEAGIDSFRHTKRVVVTGNPRASEVVRIAPEDVTATVVGLDIDRKRPLVVITSGSRGASPINDAALAWLLSKEDMDYQVVWVTGQVHYEQIANRTQALSEMLKAAVKIVPFHHDMPSLLSLAALIISRAGGTTLAEITALGVPAILIPSPYVTHRHQDYNAAALVNAGAAKLLDEAQLGGESLKRLAEQLVHNRFALEEMRRASLKLGRPDALARIGAEIDRLTAPPS